MKKQFTLLLLLALPFCVRAQSIFGPIGAEWHHFGTYYRLHGEIQDVHSLVVAKATLDTLIQGTPCRKIEQKAVMKVITDHPGGTVSTEHDSMVLRSLFVYNNVDTVFIYNEIFERFTPLYVFNAQEGDTICLPVVRDLYNHADLANHPISGDTSFCFTVDSIRNVVYGTDTLRTFYTNFLSDQGHDFSPDVPVYNWSPYYYTHANKGCYAELIGGVGSSLLPTRIDTWVEKPGRAEFQALSLSFRCYSDSVHNINITNSPCDSMPPSITGIKEQTLNGNVINIFPNPSTGVFSIEAKEPLANETSIRITDISGRMIKKGIIPVGKRKAGIALEVQAGIYFLILTTEDAKYYQKIIIRP